MFQITSTFLAAAFAYACIGSAAYAASAGWPTPVEAFADYRCIAQDRRGYLS